MRNVAEDLIPDEFIEAMSKKGIQDRTDLIFHFPKKYRDFRKPDESLDAVKESRGDGADAYLKVKLCSKPNISSPKGRGPQMMKALIDDGRRQYFITKFGGVFPWKRLNSGDFAYLYGKVSYDDFNGYDTLKNPELIPREFQGKIAPVYSACGKTYPADDVGTHVSIAVDSLLQDAEARVARAIGDTSQNIAREVSDDFKNVGQILMGAHRPVSGKHLEKAKAAIRLINALHVVVQTKESHIRPPLPEAMISYSFNEVSQSLEGIPFSLMKEQKLAIKNITDQLASRTPMDHLIYGDVGCGKTVSYLVPSILAQKKGAQVVILAPNSLLAGQIFSDCQKFSPSTPAHLIGTRMKKRESDAIDLSEKPILVGTSALFKFLKSRDEFEGVHLLVCDEQQKLGASQKEVLLSPFTNIIEATATPVPRTVAHSLYSDKAVSFIENPPVEKSIETKIIPPSLRRNAFEEMEKVIASGDQIAIVCPNRVQNYTWFDVKLQSEEDSDQVSERLKGAGLTKVSVREQRGSNYIIRCRQRTSNLFEDKDQANKNIEGVTIKKWDEVSGEENLLESKRNVESVGQMWEDRYPGQVVTIHGKMTKEEKIEGMKRALDEDTKVVVTSSLIEVGLTFPRLRAMIIQSSETMGISTLHQLRGRLARHGGYGLFMLGVRSELDNLPDQTRDRLTIMTKETKGSRLAEADMYHRGVGDLSAKGVVQSGNMEALFPGMKILPVDLNNYLIRKEQIKRLEQRSETADLTGS